MLRSLLAGCGLLLAGSLAAEAHSPYPYGYGCNPCSVAGPVAGGLGPFASPVLGAPPQFVGYSTSQVLRGILGDDEQPAYVRPPVYGYRPVRYVPVRYVPVRYVPVYPPLQPAAVPVYAAPSRWGCGCRPGWNRFGF